MKSEEKETKEVKNMEAKKKYDKLLSFDELVNVDLTEYITKRDGADYINWAKIVELLHQYGAKEVWFEPVQQENGSSLIMSKKTFTDSKGSTNDVYETRIKIKIDDMEFEMQGPVMNGSNPVKDNSMSQQRLWNCQTRLFAKGVAIHTGLGFKLWSRLETEDENAQKFSNDDILEVGKRVKEKLTNLMVNKEMTMEDIATSLKFENVSDMQHLLSYYGKLNKFEEEIDKLNLKNDKE